MMKRCFLVILMALLGKICSAQQNGQYNQYMFNGIYINPAYAGYKEILNIHTFYRSQWTGITGAPESFSLAVDAITNTGNVGLSFQVSSNKMGVQSSQVAYASYAYRLRINAEDNARLALGLSAGLMQVGIDGSKLETNDPEMEMPSGMHSTIIPDARAGVYFNNDKFYAGFSVDNIVSQMIDANKFAYIPRPRPQYYLTGGTLLRINEDMQVRPSLLIKDGRGEPTNLDVNGFLMIKSIVSVGASYRTAVKLYKKSYLQHDLSTFNSMAGVLELYPARSLRISYAYDFSLGSLGGYSNGSHAIAVGVYLGKSETRMITPRLF